MRYGELFHLLHPGFFQAEGIRAMPPEWVFTELVMDLRAGGPEGGSVPCPDGITFGAYSGDMTPLLAAVEQVDKTWPQYFREGGRYFCAFDGDRIAAFCCLDDMGTHQGLHIGGPGCVGTVPTYRRQGIGLRMVQLATETLRREGFDLSWIHCTHLAPWYMKLGYQPVLQWNSRGFLPDP